MPIVHDHREDLITEEPEEDPITKEDLKTEDLEEHLEKDQLN